MDLPIKNVQVKFTNEEHAEIYAAIRQRGKASFQAVCRDLMVEWTRGDRPDPIHGLPAGPQARKFLEMALQFYDTAPEQIRNLIEDNMRRFIEVEH